jgi:hypothetical protein
VDVTLASTSATGAFATSATGPFTPTLALQLPAGRFATAQVFYRDTTAGSAILTASAPGVLATTQAVSVTGAAPVSLRIDPSTATVPLGSAATFTAVGLDAFGNPLATVSAAWSLAPGTPGTIAPTAGPSTTYTASGRVGAGAVVATVTTPAGPIAASAPITVTPPPVARVSAIRYGVRAKTLYVYATVVDARGRRVNDAGVTVFLYRNGKLYARASGRTVRGRMTFTRPASWGTYRARVKRVSATGLRWNGKTPTNRFVKPVRRPPRKR